MKYIRLYMLTIALFLGIGGVLLAPVALAASTSPQSTVCTTLGSNAACSSTPANGVDISNLAVDIINILSIVVGVVAVFMIIIAGIRFITSNGDSNNVSSARSTIIYAIVGLVVVALAQVIVQFVLGRLF
jgi:hypothetical protein